MGTRLDRGDRAKRFELKKKKQQREGVVGVSSHLSSSPSGIMRVDHVRTDEQFRNVRRSPVIGDIVH